MKKRNSLVGILCLLSLITMFSLPINSLAHPQGVTCFSGGEVFGYIVDCGNHQENASFTWNTSIPDTPIAVDYPYRKAMTDGAAKWSGTVTITYTSTNSINGNIYTFSNPNSSTLGMFHDYGSDSKGHLIRWKIGFNKSMMDSLSASDKAIVAAHELGHAIGLNDLRLPTNQDKLMYFSWPLNTTVPTAQDKSGAQEATMN